LKHNAFTMVELIFVIVVIGILASVAIPKLSGVTDGAKKSAEIATISAVVTAIETANGEWSINEGTFTWGNRRLSSELNHGYPTKLGSDPDKKPFDYVIKGNNSKFTNVSGTNNGVIEGTDYNISIFTGPASGKNGVKFTTESGYNNDIPNKPDKNDFWVYASYVKDECNITCTECNSQTVYSGDFVLIDVNGTDTTLPNITCN